jgi:hypothetical protein
MSDFNDLVAELVRDSDQLRLPPASTLRAAGDARTRRHVLAVVGVAVLVFAVLGGAGLALADEHPRPVSTPPKPSAPVLPASPSAPVASPSAAPSASTPIATPSVPPSPVACTASDLAFVQSGQGGAMGSLYITYVVRNQSAVGCQLSGAPRLRADSGAVPSTYAGGGDTVLVPPGGQASFVVREVDGYGGYGPGSPQCAHPATYRHLAVELSDGSALPLGDSTLSVQCGEIDTAVWTLAN